MSEPHLRAVPESDPGRRPPAAAGSESERRWVPLALACALALALVLLVWSRVELGQRIGVLEDEVVGLEATLEERERLISAHERRESAVRERVAELQLLLDQPLQDGE